LPSDRHADGIAQHRIGEARDFLRHGGGEEQCLPSFRKHRDNLLDVVDEAHIEHAVGFVENQHFYLVEPQRTAVHQIEQAAGCGHKYFHASRQRADLPIDWYAADCKCNVQRADVTPIRLETVGNLARQFARGRKHQYAAGFLRGTLALVEQVIQDRQCKGCGLAGTGLCDADDVAALRGNRNGLSLDRSGSDVFFIRKSAGDRLCEAEFVE
jgi:hypothetical protein